MHWPNIYEQCTNHRNFIEDKTCPICQAVFTTHVSCKRHIATVHEEKKKYECYECLVKFNDKSTLSTHIKGIHMDKKPFNCKFCPKGFIRMSRLLKHESKCSRKENMFDKSDNLKRHTRQNCKKPSKISKKEVEEIT